MNPISNELFKAIRYALYAGATAAAGLSAGTVLAQDAPDQGAQKLDTITVTGSNIRRVDIETSNPVVTIDRATIEQTGKLTLGDILQNLPAVTGGGYNPQINNSGGDGSSTIGLRGLGAQRTLLLVNGQRIIANGLSPDPNSIPANMIERIEVLSDGASAVYGSDAIAGVINIILKKEYQGVQLSMDYGTSDKDDGLRKGLHLMFGQTGDKGSIMGGIDYNKTDAILAGNRKFSASALDITGSPSTPPYTLTGGSSYPAFGRIQLPKSMQGLFGCSTVALNPGASGTTVDTNNYHCFTNSDKYNYAAVNLIQTPQERTSLFLNGIYHITDHIDFYADAWHNKTSSNFQLAPALFGTPAGGTISSQSYYNPFGEDFLGGGADFRLRLVSVGPRQGKYATNTDQVHTGFKGNFNIGQQNWTWDAGFGYGHISQNLITIGLPNFDTLNQAFGPSFLDPSTGTVVCGTPGNVISGCTPFNPFNQYDPASAAGFKAAAVPAISQYYNQERDEHVDLSGGLFDLPAGTLQLAAGVSHRSEYQNQIIDPLLLIDPSTLNCVLGSQCSSPLQGGYTVREAYAELFVPVLKDLPFVRALNVTLGDRYSKYSTFGSTNNTKIALEWRPIDDLLLRGTVSQVFRAPTVSNVYGAPISDAPSLSFDPCDYAGGANPNASNPACKGVPTTGGFTNTDVALGQQIQAVSTGNQYAVNTFGFPKIGPEHGKSFDWGVVYDPSWLPGVSVSADLWRVYLNNTIAAPVSAQSVLSLCFNGVTAFCPLITRYQSGENAGQIDKILEPTGNVGRSDVKGVDFGGRYKLPELPYGQFTVIANATYLAQYNVNLGYGLYHMAGHAIPFDSPALSGCPDNAGVCTLPRWKASLALNWKLGAFDASWRMRYIGRFSMGNANLDEQQTAVQGIDGYVLKYGATTYNDLQFGYNIEALNTRIDVGIDNAFNKLPPMMYFDTNTLNAGTDPTTFDLIGRYYWARLTIKF
ncbi:MAG: TonB-dependent receptor [Rhodanobacter sp.]|jgi:outer membrane receptor protein involved in Fe transport|nr:TonB-dependent receptor [Rhodanobacter sp.]